MSRPLRVLLVEDSEDDAGLLVREIERHDYAVHSARVQTEPALEATLAHDTWDVILCDFTLPQFGGEAALRVVRERGPTVPFIYVSGTIGEETAVAALQAGAHDYVMKRNLTRLVPAIERGLREAQMRRENARADQAMRVSEYKYRCLFESLPDAAFLLDPASGRVIDTNPQAEVLLGRTRSEILWMNQAQLYAQEDVAAPPVCWPVDCAGEHHPGCDAIVRRRDGSTVPAHVFARRVELYGRRLLWALFREVMERPRAEAEVPRLAAGPGPPP